MSFFQGFLFGPRRFLMELDELFHFKNQEKLGDKFCF